MALESQSNDLLLVTQEEFNAIECNRCGDCCEKFWISDEALIKNVLGNTHWIDGEKTTKWLNEIIPISPIIEKDGYPAGRYYKCPRFKRDEDGTGVCTQYEERSHICSGFPNNRPQSYVRCSWYVRLLKDDGKIEDPDIWKWSEESSWDHLDD